MSDDDKDDLEYVEEYPVFNRTTSRPNWTEAAYLGVMRNVR